jgi:hypothetical protein
VRLGDLREPFAPEQLLEHRARELRLALVQVGAVVRVRDAVAAPERVEHGVDRADARHDELADRRDVVEARLVEERLVVTRRKREARLVVHLEDPGRRLLLEPLADVALVQPRGAGQLVGGRRPAVGERAIEAEAHAEIDGQDVQRTEHRPE